eukprot:TRINITY_DN46007_c0_g1_i1.p1 TRINITY_DN46007_c0_g1~~TRINITY_DN46007_c0_g1_i1.p1  ORF type:complete len:345 (-),score=49.37 TRINITY_DN46007_c0_g1_i1:80-1114(-)
MKPLPAFAVSVVRHLLTRQLVRSRRHVSVATASSIPEVCDGVPICRNDVGSGASASPGGIGSGIIEGAFGRAMRLQEALVARGVDVDVLDTPPHSSLLAPAIRVCRAFVLPRSCKAFECAEKSGQASVVADEVQRLVFAAQATRATWDQRCAKLRREDLEEGQVWKHPVVVVLDGIRSKQNVGTLLQICERARVEEVVACGITPVPPDPGVIRAAGADVAARVSLRHAPSTLAAVLEFRAAGREVWALETTTQADLLEDALAGSPALANRAGLALVFGHERHGVSIAVLAACDRHVRVPTFGIKNSLNVAAVGGIAIFSVIRCWRKRNHGVGGSFTADIDASAC